MNILIFALLLIPGLANAQVYGFETVDQATYSQTKTQSVVTKMPPSMAQDTLGICYAYAASTLLTAENCRAENDSGCSRRSDDKIFSPLSLAVYGRVNGGSAKGSSGGDEGLPGGNILKALLEVAQESGFSATEDCASLDKVLSKIGGANEASQQQNAVWNRLKELYDNSKNIKSDCASCTADFYATAKDEIEKSFNVKVTNESLLKAFANDTYAKFFDQLFISPQCMRASKAIYLQSFEKIKVAAYPNDGEKGSYQGSIEKIKSVLNSGRPLGVGSLCLDKNPSSVSCKNSHSVVVSGYRKVCRGNGESDCKELVKVVNSWGESWQRKNDNGWVDARTLLDRTFYTGAYLTWLADKK